MIYLIQEATQAGQQVSASSWTNLILSAGVVAAVVGLVGVVVGQFLTGLRHSRDLRLTEQGQITDRFTRAIDQLGSEKVEIRLGGIYALERIARDSPRDNLQILEVLTAYIREHAPRHAGTPRWTGTPVVEDEPARAKRIAEGDKSPPPVKPPTDIQAILDVLRRREAEHLSKEYRVAIDLRDTDLRKANLVGIDLQQANLQKTDFEGASLAKANLQQAFLQGSDLKGADLRNANLKRALLEKANLAKANLLGATLKGTSLDAVELEEAYLLATDLRGASLRGAERLTETQVHAAIGDETTVLPDNLQHPAHWSKGVEESEEG